MSQVELFQGLVCFTPFWGVIDLLLVCHFFFSWIRSARTTGWKIDFWFLTLLLFVFPSLCLLYPFSGSIYNLPFTLGHYEEILPYIDQAFFLSVLGYAFLWIGRWVFDLSRERHPLILPFQAALPLCRLVEGNIKSQRACLAITLSAVFLGLLIHLLQWQTDSLFNARAWFLQQHQLRPFFNLTLVLFSSAFSFLTLRWIQYKEKRWIKWFFLLLLLSLFFGVRSIAIGALFSLLTQSIFYKEGKCSLIRLAFLGSGLFLGAVLLGSLREGGDVTEALRNFLIHFFYGNQFSDTRDFAWILTFWDGEYLYGKTYLAALLSFIPRFLSPLRQEWSISMYTNGLTGFDSELMPGLRPGLFGEAFLNFGYVGVIFFGFLFGFALRYADVKIKTFVSESKDIIRGYSHQIVFSFVSFLSTSSAMWGFYAFVLIHLGLILVRGRVSLQTDRTPS